MQTPLPVGRGEQRNGPLRGSSAGFEVRQVWVHRGVVWAAL